MAYTLMQYNDKKNIPNTLPVDLRHILHESAKHLLKTKMKYTIALARKKFGISIERYHEINREIRRAIGFYPFRTYDTVKKKNENMSAISYAEYLGVKVGEEWTPPV